MTIRTGYQDKVNVQAALELRRKRGLLERNLDLEHASYFVSRIMITPTDEREMALWRKKFFIMMARNAAARSSLRPAGERTVMMGSQVML